MKSFVHYIYKYIFMASTPLRGRHQVEASNDTNKNSYVWMKFYNFKIILKRRSQRTSDFSFGFELFIYFFLSIDFFSSYTRNAIPFTKPSFATLIIFKHLRQMKDKFYKFRIQWIFLRIYLFVFLFAVVSNCKEDK